MSETSTPPYVSYLRGRGWGIVKRKAGVWMAGPFTANVFWTKAELIAAAIQEGYIPEVEK